MKQQREIPNPEEFMSDVYSRQNIGSVMVIVLVLTWLILSV